ncbi:MAG: DUF7146 domain-containing protein, partial [Candidatus Dormibacteria bacterium]
VRQRREGSGGEAAGMTGLSPAPEAVEALGRRCFGEPNKRLSTARELRFGRKGSISLDPARGVWFDHESGKGGGLRELGEPNPMRARETAAERQGRVRAAEIEAERRKTLAGRLWRSASPLAGSLAETYLRQARAIRAPLDTADLRFLASAPYWPANPDCRERHPAMIARVADARGRGLGVHLSVHASDGLGKAAVTPARKCLGPVGGGFIRLIPGSRLLLSEGVESALSAWEARPASATDHGAVASISAGGMARLAWPADAEELIVAPDNDQAGEDAALALARRAHAAGLTVGFMRPPEGFGDWNDWARRERL